jgi:hypothetical protein
MKKLTFLLKPIQKYMHKWLYIKFCTSKCKKVVFYMTAFRSEAPVAGAGRFQPVALPATQQPAAQFAAAGQQQTAQFAAAGQQQPQQTAQFIAAATGHPDPNFWSRSWSYSAPTYSAQVSHVL